MLRTEYLRDQVSFFKRRLQQYEVDREINERANLSHRIEDQLIEEYRAKLEAATQLLIEATTETEAPTGQVFNLNEGSN